jgi:DNA-binding HxlR family transcriptional regulator
MNPELKEEVTRSRSTLALALRELQEERLIEREVVDTRPVQTRYSLTGLGAEVAGHLSEIKRLISGHPE